MSGDIQVNISRIFLQRLLAINNPTPSEADEVKRHVDIVCSHLESKDDISVLCKQLKDFFTGGNINTDLFRVGPLADWANTNNMQWIIGVFRYYHDCNDASVLTFLSRLHELLGQKEEALSLLTKSITIEPIFSAYRSRAHLYHEMGNMEAEVKDHEVALSMANSSPSRCAILSQMAEALRRLRRPQEALKYIDDSLRLAVGGGRIQPLLVKVKTLIALGRVKETPPFLEEGLGYDGSNPYFLIEKANVLHRLQNVEEAYHLLQSIHPRQMKPRISKLHYQCIICEAMYDRTHDFKYLQMAKDSSDEYYKGAGWRPERIGKLALKYAAAVQSREEKELQARPRSDKEEKVTPRRQPDREKRSPSPSKRRSPSPSKRNSKRRSRSPSKRERSNKGGKRYNSPSRKRSRSPRFKASRLQAEIEDLTYAICDLGVEYRDYRDTIIRNGITEKALKLILKGKLEDSINMLMGIGIKRIHAMVIINRFSE